MFKIFRYYIRLYPCVTVKLLFLLLVAILAVNLLLYYNLKSIGYIQTTVDVLQNKDDFQSSYGATVDKRNGRNSNVDSCEPGNYTILVSNLIYEIRDKLDPFYSTSPNTTDLFRKCAEFLNSKRKLHRNGILASGRDIDFANKNLISLLKTSPVLKVQNAPKGSQMKLLAYLANNISIIIKPKWYSSNDVLEGNVYVGKDRHFGEVIAFYLSILLNMRRVPPATFRTFDLRKEIIKLADKKLLDTFIFRDNATCFYGVCLYCNPGDLWCTNSNSLETAVTFYVSSVFPLRLQRHPWSRTYRCNIKSRWETDANYCQVVKNSKFYSNPRNMEIFLDFMDVAIFDFLISNGDRHRYEYIDRAKIPHILLIDNGKSFGNPEVDHVDILAPLYQCCVLRNSTWNDLLQLRGGNLSKWLRYLLENSENTHTINNKHFVSMDRRLSLIFAAVNFCFDKYGITRVLTN